MVIITMDDSTKGVLTQFWGLLPRLLAPPKMSYIITVSILRDIAHIGRLFRCRRNTTCECWG